MRTIVIFTAALSLAAPLQAAPLEPITAQVGIADLDLASSSGQRALKHRIASAVEHVCGSYANAREYYEEMRVDACRRSAMASAREQVASKFTTLRVAANDHR